MTPVTATPQNAAVSPSGDGGPTRAVVTGVAKAFGATRALVDGNVEIHAGEVHAVMGENGSGKSTLVKILSGVHRPDHGSLTVDGCLTPWLSNPARSRASGISTVFQEVLTVPGRSILENVWLGSGSDRGLPTGERRRRAGQALEALLGTSIDVDASVDSLSLSERQACCIARSLVTEPSLLILDESTASLDAATRDRLFAVLRERTSRGVSVLFISHRMDEIFAISDVVTVLRSGVTVATRLLTSDSSPQQLVSLMSEAGEAPPLRAPRTPGPLLLRAEDVRLSPYSAPVTFELRAGELVGLAGLEGQGQDLFLQVLNGTAVPDGGVVRRVYADAVDVVNSSAAAGRNGIAYVPRERRREGLFEQLSILENFGLPRLKDDSFGPLLLRRRTEARLHRVGARLRIKMRSGADPISSLSGGNQQKVLVARSLAEDPQVLLLNDPTRGIDAMAKHDLYDLLLDLCAEGCAVVILSSEVEEIVELVDRVVVFRGNEVSAHLAGERMTSSGIVAAYFASEDEATSPVSRSAPPESSGMLENQLLARPKTGSRRATAKPWLFSLLLVAALLIANGFVQESFFSPHRWVTMLATISPFVLVAYASTAQILAGRGGIDISVGPLTTLVNCLLVAVLIPHGMASPWLSLPLLLLVGAAAGFLNGFLVVVGRLQSVIATLATFFIFSGLALKFSPTPVFAGENWTSHLAGSMGPVPGGALLIIVGSVGWLALGRIGYLRKLYLVGSDDVATFSAGINVVAVRIAAYVIGGVFAALAGIALTAVIQTSQATLAGTYSLIALAAVSLGGTSLAGGRGGLRGSFLGATAIFLLQEFLGGAGVPVSYVQFTYGFLLVAGVILSGITSPKGPNR
jgi:ABC-type sugar transport system ATPase subunit/ribose/xylose/arabinose/galactoside ABC-type transport system permease subunit